MRFIAIIAYLLNAGLYLLFSPALKARYANEFSAWYFGSEGVFVAILLVLALSCKNWIEKQLIVVVAGFIFIRAILYTLNYTLIFTVNARLHMIFLALYMLLIVTPTFISAYRHGHFKK